ncbi:MAG: hypothetical protein JW940_10450 [Polyangiaceae bacterium]|nr:hypothetical protein [Polyangiaceae bacterium]
MTGARSCHLAGARAGLTEATLDANIVLMRSLDIVQAPLWSNGTALGKQFGMLAVSAADAEQGQEADSDEAGDAAAPGAKS